VAAAGPASNLVLALTAAVLFRLLATAADPIARTLFFAVELNVLLAVFNMLPIPPLDGGNVLAGLVRGPAAAMLDRLRPYGFLVLYALMFSGALWAIVSPVERQIISRLLGL